MSKIIEITTLSMVIGCSGGQFSSESPPPATGGSAAATTAEVLATGGSISAPGTSGSGTGGSSSPGGASDATGGQSATSTSSTKLCPAVGCLHDTDNGFVLYSCVLDTSCAAAGQGVGPYLCRLTGC